MPGEKQKGGAEGPKGEVKKDELKEEEVKQEEAKHEANEVQKKNPTIDTTAPKDKPALLSPAIGGSSWAEQVEAGSPVVTTAAATTT